LLDIIEISISSTRCSNYNFRENQTACFTRKKKSWKLLVWWVGWVDTATNLAFEMP